MLHLILIVWAPISFSIGIGFGFSRPQPRLDFYFMGTQSIKKEILLYLDLCMTTGMLSSFINTQFCNILSNFLYFWKIYLYFVTFKKYWHLGTGYRHSLNLFYKVCIHFDEKKHPKCWLKEKYGFITWSPIPDRYDIFHNICSSSSSHSSIVLA